MRAAHGKTAAMRRASTRQWSLEAQDLAVALNLDTVELLIRGEKEFSINIPNANAARLVLRHTHNTP